MLRATMWLLSAGLVACALWLWPEVPDRVPLHHGADGTPDRWGDRSLLSWLGLPLVGLGVSALLDWTAWWTARRPDSPLVNLPRKRELLALPPERRAPVLRVVARMVYGLGVLSAAALFLIQLGIWTTAQGRDGSAWILAATAALLAGSVAGAVWGSVRAGAEVERQQAAGG